MRFCLSAWFNHVKFYFTTGTTTFFRRSTNHWNAIKVYLMSVGEYKCQKAIISNARVRYCHAKLAHFVVCMRAILLLGDFFTKNNRKFLHRWRAYCSIPLGFIKVPEWYTKANLWGAFSYIICELSFVSNGF